MSTMKIRHIYSGDCINVMKKLPISSVDLIFSDPPYNLSGKNLSLIGNKTGGDYYKINEKWDKMTEKDYTVFTNSWIKHSYDLLKPSGSIYICCTLHNINNILNAVKKTKINVKHIITWYKTNAMPSITKRSFTHSSEFLVYGVKNSKWIFNYFELKKINPEKQKNGDMKQMRDVWTIPITQGVERLKRSDGRALHPTQKPEELIKRAIIASSNSGDLIFDPFMGSGTTAVVAERLKRKWIGVEKNAYYRRHAMERIKRYKLRKVKPLIDI
ncbi:MAG: DNA methylase [Cenarchaeum symbiont of Oopsacas minuta]|nr:DNA methylase [Cenarchaeum symbiont of Oopsacas minuta]